MSLSSQSLALVLTTKLEQQKKTKQKYYKITKHNQSGPSE